MSWTIDYPYADLENFILKLPAGLSARYFHLKHSVLKAKALSRLKVKAAYERMEPEFALLQQLLKARQKAGLTQADVADRMGTKPPAITRLESSLGSGKHSPSLSTLQKYAEAVGCELQVKFVRAQNVRDRD